jgi:HTH-type transcriptional regulator, sugar sensing transcriptional regulator
MANKQDLIKKVKYHFCLNIYESKVWVALLGKSIASVGEIAEISGVPRSRVYDVLESLEKKGFAVAKLGKPVKFIAVKPAVVIERMKNNLMKEASERVNGLVNVKNSIDYKELETLYTDGIKPIQVEDLTSAVKGRSNIYSQMKDLIGNAQKEVVLISTLDALKRKSSFLKPLFEKLKEKGVSIVVASNETEDMKGLINLSRQLGVQVKRTRANARLLVVDNSKMLITITPDNSEESDVAISISSPFFARTITSFLPSFN